LQIFYAMNARKAKLIRIRTRQISASQAKIVPGRAQRAFFGEAPRRRVGGRRERHGFPEGAQSTREVEVLKNRNVAISLEPLEDVASHENGLVAEMPAPEAIPEAGEAAGDRENE
jgi:hypothetical protein